MSGCCPFSPDTSYLFLDAPLTAPHKGVRCNLNGLGSHTIGSFGISMKSRSFNDETCSKAAHHNSVAACHDVHGVTSDIRVSLKLPSIRTGSEEKVSPTSAVRWEQLADHDSIKHISIVKHHSALYVTKHCEDALRWKGLRGVAEVADNGARMARGLYFSLGLPIVGTARKGAPFPFF